ncbi:peptidyl-prolyl cis-trans isomerase [Plasmodium gonderi]|uniref:Peptidyl-prolyl cis-trans isomerase n=1 Tax=Plasmodium gonderi TaxID=77519 RepID=A0A1Y1JED7_PLAGO|nr:peptidyl-prolyl cis-trans isomerase [Plasmodium gonderi]GAW80889.1 peptidyl-prolyl cis-trans isomerase [Plasmodium gonderi]
MNIKTSEDVYKFVKDCIKIKEEIDNTKKLPKKEKKNTCESKNKPSKYNFDYSKFESCLKEIEDDEEEKENIQEKKQHILNNRNPCTHDHSKERQLYEKDSKENIKASNAFNEEGKKAFYEKNYKLACIYFRKGLIQLDYSFPELKQEKDEQSKLEINLHLNMAITKFHMSNYYECISECSTVLNLDKNNVKAHYRKGQAYMCLDMYNEAKIEFLKVLEINPADKYVKNSLLTLKRKILIYNKKEKLVCSKVFSSNENKENNLMNQQMVSNNDSEKNQINHQNSEDKHSDECNNKPMMTMQDDFKNEFNNSVELLNCTENNHNFNTYKMKEYINTSTTNESKAFGSYTQILLLNNVFLYLLVCFFVFLLLFLFMFLFTSYKIFFTFFLTALSILFLVYYLFVYTYIPAKK